QGDFSRRSIGRESATGPVLRGCTVVARGIAPPPPALPILPGLAAGLNNQIGAPNGLGNPNLRCLEVDAFDLAHHVQNRCRGRAGAMRAAFGVVPAPGWMLVLMVRVGAADVAGLAIPLNAQRP